MIQSLTDFVQFLVFLSVLINLFFLGETFLSQLSDLHLIILRVEELPFVFFDAHSENLNLLRKSFDFNSLKYNDKLDIISEIGLFIVGQILNP